ncbi:MAG: two-component system OmpR family phosphate regulon sensor histidine kinase PhoR [Chloroflexi bacterium]|nr:MAG: two-component system OmpR family phosphate regulon sensor histidine kinase PhoR [Chloroflexota bacterium]
MKGLSYVQKTAIPYLLLLVIVLAGIGFTTSLFFERFVLTSWKEELTTEASLISEQLDEQLLNLDASYDLSRQVLKFSEITGDRVTLILADGTVIAESDHDLVTMENHLQRPEVQAAINGKIEPTIRLSTTMHQRYIYVAAAIYDGKVAIGVIRLAKSLALYDATIARFRLILYLVAGCSAMIALLLIFMQSSKKFNPLRKISEEIYTMSEVGELKTIVGVDRKDEIGLVVSAHNSLVEKINFQIQTLQNEQTKLSAILSNMTDGVILVNADGIVTLINTSAQRLFNVIRQTTDGVSLIEVVRQHQIVELWKQTLQSGKTQSATIQTSLDKDNIQVIASILGPVLPGEVLLLFQDLTLLRKLETVRKDFISNISHELRTPLASLKALTETLQNGALHDPAVSNRFLLQMDEEIDNLTQIVQELLELSKIESGRVPLEKKRTSAHEIVSRPVERMKLQAERAGITLETILPAELPNLDVDLTKIHQVFMNLIHNAIKFTPPGGRISVAAQLQTDSVVFSIADSGTGILPNDLKRVFERFYKSDRSRSGGGTGLGLSISRHIVEIHDGKIWAESTPGEGSTFHFSIPITSGNDNKNS